jgi:hypothetical protein
VEPLTAVEGNVLQASERPRGVASRIKGKTAIIRSLALLLIRVHRFGSLRASTYEDRAWAGRLFDDLHAALHRARK